jgi:hypothetical protein
MRSMSTQLGVAVLVVCLLAGWGPPVQAGPVPRVVRTTPASDARAVNPALSEIVIEFDQPMQAGSWSLVVVDGVAFPELVGDTPIQFRDECTCVVRVKLKPETAYGLGLNSPTRTGFKSAGDGTPATPFQLRFQTGVAGGGGAADGPRVIRTDPPDGATGLAAGTYDLTIVFNVPMQATATSLMTPPGGPHLRVIGQPTWQDARTFVVPILLSDETTYRVGVNTGPQKRFVSAGDGTPAVGHEFSFATRRAGAPPSQQDEVQPAKQAGPVQLRYNYQVGDTARAMQRSGFEMKLDLSNGQSFPIAQHVGTNAIDEVLGVEKGQPIEVRKMISEYVLIITNPETGGQPQAAPRLNNPVVAKINRRWEPVNVEVIEGEAPNELLMVLSEDSFLDVVPREPVAIGKTFALPPATLAEIKSAFDAAGTGDIDIQVTCRRIGPREVPDARNEMFKAQGGGTPVTYIFDVAEFTFKWKQSGSMENGIEFTLDATGEIVFAIEAGVLLKLAARGDIKIKPTQLPDDNGQMVTVTGGGQYDTEYTYEPIKWTRGARQKSGAVAAPPSSTPADAPGTPRDAIARQFELLKAGDVDQLRLCFVPAERAQITAELVAKARGQASAYTLDELVAEVIENDGATGRSVTVKMRNGRTLTTLKLSDGVWLAESIWFQ